ncbi:aldo/keto reductase family protein [Rhizoctonia solani]|uniref:Aldo/keto reductase family protein n=1 Tax=Rhizoctonia solani TaxID=456999 RepID=A0A8H8NN85_9AGAM|nr:aldo/keto reductase family protein [Rhizoctonia solani]QRW16405.1 aldo/keto reductase family protein [Rhizoctonia solani]
MSTSTLPTRRIGNDNVTALGFGAMGIGGLAYGAAGDDEGRFKVLDKLVELGCTNWDTADIYGDSEALIGKWFKRTGKRDQIFLATKFAITPRAYNVRRSLKQQLDKSLGLLGVDAIDLYYVHRIDTTVPIETTVGALAELVKAGKIKYIGLSEPSPATLRRAHKVHPIAAIQVEYSPFVLDIEQKGHLLDTARELGVAVVAYSPLGRGILTGQVTSNADIPDDDFKKHIPKYSEANFPKITSLVNKIKDIGKRHDATPGQVTLAFLLAQGEDIIPIPGTKNIKYAEENLGALKVKLTPEDIKTIRQAITETELTGDQYPAAYMGHYTEIHQNRQKHKSSNIEVE